MFEGHIQFILHSLVSAPILIPFGVPGGITEQSGMGVRNHCRNQFLKNCQITRKWDPITLHFKDWLTKHTQTGLAKSIRLWESISSIKWAHTAL